MWHISYSTEHTPKHALPSRHPSQASHASAHPSFQTLLPNLAPALDGANGLLNEPLARSCSSCSYYLARVIVSRAMRLHACHKNHVRCGAWCAVPDSKRGWLPSGRARGTRALAIRGNGPPARVFRPSFSFPPGLALHRPGPSWSLGPSRSCSRKQLGTLLSISLFNLD